MPTETATNPAPASVPASPPLPPPATSPPWAPATLAHPPAHRVRCPTEPADRARRRVGVVTVVSSLLLASVLTLTITAVVGTAIGMWRFRVIDTGSMRPTLNPGDVVVLTPERTADLARGQIVAFHPPGESRLTVVHRVFSIDRVRNGVIIQTKGDANNAPDAWRARIVTNTVWVETLKAPKVGYLAVWTQQRPVRFGLFIAIVTLALSMSLGAIWRRT